MENKINIAELLKDCPKGMELYSPLCGKCVFDRINMGTIICKKENTQEITFTSDGYYMLPVFDDCECMIFPSKDQRDWSKFHRPFKDGDICYIKTGAFEHIFIFKESKDAVYIQRYVNLSESNLYTSNASVCMIDNVEEFRFATEDEKQKLFQAIKDNGYRWNAETKTLEKLIEPKFKVGDKIKHKNGYFGVSILKINTDCYTAKAFTEDQITIDFTHQDEYELVPNKFDINTLVPFESKVLVRNVENQRWIPAFWGYKRDNGYITTFGWCQYCIPYECNEHLLNTVNDCDTFYKTWE